MSCTKPACSEQYNFVSCFADGRMMLFGAEIFNNFPNRGYVCTYNVQAAASGNTQVFAHFSSKISTLVVLKGERTGGIGIYGAHISTTD